MDAAATLKHDTHASSAPAPSHSIGYQLIALADITPSKTNPRRHFDKAKLKDLAASVKAHGVLEPILVRPQPGTAIGAGKFEIIAGERRYRASKLAELFEIPVIVKHLNDEQTLELQVIENVQRDDLHPLEEAQGYGDLVKIFKHTQDDIAAKVGKSKSYIAQRMKLLDLVPSARKLFLEGKLTASTALIVARIADPQRQAEAAKEVATGQGWAMSTAEARRHIADRYLLDLSKAPFDTKDAALAECGACTACPKRTGNQTALFEDIAKGDHCLDSSCYQAKATAHSSRLIAAAEKNGQRVITGKAAKALLQSPYGDYLSGNEFDRLDDETYAGGKYTKISSIVGKDYRPTLIVHPHCPGHVVEVVPKADLAKAAKEKGLKLGYGNSSSISSSPAQKEANRKARIERETRKRIFEATRDASAGGDQLPTEQLRIVVARVWDRWWHDHKKPLVGYWTPEPTPDPKKKRAPSQAVHDRLEVIDKLIPKLTHQQLLQLLVDCILASHLEHSPYEHRTGDSLLEMAKLRNVDVVAIKRQVADEMAPKKKAAAKKVKGAKPAKKPGSTPTKKAARKK